MFLKLRKASTDQRLRSLLQKAVRRGFSRIVSLAAMRLDAVGDKTWLRSRTIVITFEECWPLAESLSINRELSSKLNVLLRVTRSSKQKDAAGLGALAHAYQEGDRSMLEVVPDQRALKIIAEALDRPKEFFDWVKGEGRSQGSRDVVRAAQEYLPAATWRWDKACILGGALLATLSDLPSLESLEEPEEEFPYWVALDKHTAEGKEVLREVAKEIKASYRELIWASFYCESAHVNKPLSSPWFNAERLWRFRRTGLSLESAEELWSRARPLVRERLETEALALKNLVESSLPHESMPQQSSLL
jgi:hypothetical protein